MKLNTLLWDANLIDGDGNIQYHKNIEIADSVIVAINNYEEGAALPEAEESICCRDFVITPGFVNMHAHAAISRELLRMCPRMHGSMRESGRTRAR